MPLSIMLSEDDLRAMPSDLRDGLLKWYFDANRTRAIPSLVAPTKTAQPAMMDDESRRVTFAKLAAAGLLKTGQEIYCRTLKRQQRNGKPKFIKGARVSPQGTVEFEGNPFSNPSTLAVSMVKQSGGKPTALNGFDYLFVQSGKDLVSLKKLRDQLMNPNEQRLRAEAEARVEDIRTLYGQDTEPEDHLPHLRQFMR